MQPVLFPRWCILYNKANQGTRPGTVDSPQKLGVQRHLSYSPAPSIGFPETLTHTVSTKMPHTSIVIQVVGSGFGEH